MTSVHTVRARIDVEGLMARSQTQTLTQYSSGQSARYNRASINGDGFMESRAEVKAPPQGSATYCAEGTGGLEIRKTLGNFVVSE